MAESEQIWRAYMKFENIAEIYSARMDSSVIFDINWENNGGLEQIWRTHVKIENTAEIYSALMDISKLKGWALARLKITILKLICFWRVHFVCFFPDDMHVFHIGKRNPPYQHWEPIYIGTHEDPLYDERLSWEGRSDKMTQVSQYFNFLL